MVESVACKCGCGAVPPESVFNLSTQSTRRYCNNALDCMLCDYVIVAMKSGASANVVIVIAIVVVIQAQSKLIPDSILKHLHAFHHELSLLQVAICLFLKFTMED